MRWRGWPTFSALPQRPRRLLSRSPLCPGGALTADTVASPSEPSPPRGAIICDESITTGRNFFPATRFAAPHDWLQLSGGSIGLGIPMATGAAIACPDRKVINLQADGSGLYTAQGALDPGAREPERADADLGANRSYAVLKAELANVGANPGRKAPTC
jgi:acetolactate synthase-1/2/3 large subunit